MNQYEFLKQIIHAQKQKDVCDYIREKNNPTPKSDYIGFSPTRRPHCSFEEKNITYCRNLIGHYDLIVRSDKTISEELNELFSSMSKAIVRVIYFALKQMD